MPFSPYRRFKRPGVFRFRINKKINIKEKIKETFEHLLFEELDVANKNFEGLKQLEEAPQTLSPEEKTELLQLFGMFPEDTSFDRDYCVKRQIYWRRIFLTGRSAQRKKLAEIAEIQYGRRITALQREKA